VAEPQFPVEHFPALDAVGQCRSAFIGRIEGIDVVHDKAEALRRLDAVHRKIRASLGMADWPLVTAEQVHGNGVAVIDVPTTNAKEFENCDGIITNQRGLALGIYVADCCAVYLVDPRTPAIGLVHSGKKGTELQIAGVALDQMAARFGSKLSEMVVQLSPCIRPPHYEVDFAAQIIKQCRDRGVQQIHDSGKCTASDLASYYSYRMEKGRTGRMLALLGLK
jgi:copper oxidase (laccase) domain-containing protein